MRIIFISDDNWFLQGVKELENVINHKLHLLNPCECSLNIDIVQNDDLFILNISNQKMRYKILNCREFHKCRGIVLTSHEKSKKVKNIENFPWIISDRINMNDISILLDNASDTKFNLKNVHPFEQEVFLRLNEGFPIRKIAALLGVTSKYIYSLKINLLKNCGLTSTHPGVVVLYKDIMKWRLNNSEN
ncbi:hypothetical protein [Klebsiella oxytoca]|uniref:hypothetical protein n=1 Tax=Klebsiella oxytoca TaxID=571 RepID=UPI000665FA82|nr:hypothetical protein [Klebsiella oxytoca]